MTDTASRSLAHWSEARRAEMDAFYRLATKDYRHLAEARDWAAWLAERSAAAGQRPLRLLDVACGSGKFPNALIDHSKVGEAGLDEIAYDLLDPSAFSVAEAKDALRPPFRPAGEHVCTLQDFDGPSGHYDVVWATHALYALPRDELAAGLSRFADCTALGGAGFIAHASEASHYLTFYRAYLDGFDHANGEPYISSADLVETLQELGVQFETEEITYENGAPEAERDAVEGYLQRCLFDDTVTLEQLLDNPSTGPYLAGKLNGGEWRFPQSVTLIDLG
jgi:SAM-dependent methyltransferase